MPPRFDLADRDAARAAVHAFLQTRGESLGDLVTRQVLQVGGRQVVRWRATTSVGVVEIAGVVDPEGWDERTTVQIGAVPVGLFLLPHDPALVGLPALDTAAAAGRLLGEAVAGTRRSRYRPLTRAVIRLDMADGTTRWAKVVPPRRVAALADVHRRCAPAVSGPRVLQVEGDLGIVVLSHVAGDDLRTNLRREGARLPDPEAIVALATSLAQVTSPRPVRRTSPLATVARNAERLLAIVPGTHADVVEQLAGTLADSSPREVVTPGPTIHGDLHSAQVMTSGARVSGLVDLDDAGAGDPVDDLARFVAHLVCTTDRSDARWARPWSRDLITSVRTTVPVEMLQPRVAAQLLSLALGPHRVHRSGWQPRTLRRLDLAGHWARPDPVVEPWAGDA